MLFSLLFRRSGCHARRKERLDYPDYMYMFYNLSHAGASTSLRQQQGAGPTSAASPELGRSTAIDDGHHQTCCERKRQRRADRQLARELRREEKRSERAERRAAGGCRSSGGGGGCCSKNRRGETPRAPTAVASAPVAHSSAFASGVQDDMHASNGDRAASQAGWAGNQSDDGEWDYQDQDHPPPSYEEVEKQQQHQQRQQR